MCEETPRKTGRMEAHSQNVPVSVDRRKGPAAVYPQMASHSSKQEYGKSRPWVPCKGWCGGYWSRSRDTGVETICLNSDNGLLILC